MALDPDYLRYPLRRYGMDHDRYGWSMLVDRKPVRWPDGADVALWIKTSLNHFPLTPRKAPVRLPGTMIAPYPDVRVYSWRDYGNRVGVFRLLRLFDRLSLRSDWVVNSRVAERYPYLLEKITARGDEIVGGGVDMEHPHYEGLPIEEEKALIDSCLSVLRGATGQPVKGWVSPGRLESFNTPDLLAGAGVEWFADWINDDMPYDFRAGSGSLLAMPAGELSDYRSVLEWGHTDVEFGEQLVDHFTYLMREARAEGGRVVSINLHPWIMGQSHRIASLERALEHIADQRGVWSASGSQIAAAWRAAQAD